LHNHNNNNKQGIKEKLNISLYAGGTSDDDDDDACSLGLIFDSPIIPTYLYWL